MHTLHMPCFLAEAYSVPLQTSKMKCFFMHPVTDFKLLTVYAKTLLLRCLKEFSIRIAVTIKARIKSSRKQTKKVNVTSSINQMVIR